MYSFDLKFGPEPALVSLAGDPGFFAAFAFFFFGLKMINKYPLKYEFIVGNQWNTIKQTTQECQSNIVSWLQNSHFAFQRSRENLLIISITGCLFKGSSQICCCLKMGGVGCPQPFYRRHSTYIQVALWFRSRARLKRQTNTNLRFSPSLSGSDGGLLAKYSAYAFLYASLALSCFSWYSYSLKKPD